MRKTLYPISFALFVFAVLCTAAQAQVVVGSACDDDATRQQFLAAVENGASEDDLEASFGQCKLQTSESMSSSSTFGDVRSTAAALKTINDYNVSYERLTGCGYHPQAEMVSCDVELWRRTGYGGFPGGTNEWVLFCLDCNADGVWDYQTSGFVHVTDDVSGGPLNFYFEAHATTFDAPAACIVNNGGWGTLRSILSWNFKPTSCSFIPFWGNRIDVTIRRDP